MTESTEYVELDGLLILDPSKVEGILTVDQQKRERVSSLARMYQGADRMLARERVTVSAAYGGAQAPAAWTDGGDIVFNLDRIDDIDLDTIIKTHGLNAHELCHVLWTPRKSTTLVKAVLDDKMFQAFNILEDQRIETLMVAKFRSVAAWLESAIYRWVMGGEKFNPQVAYLFARGRRYLKGELRGALRALFIAPDLLPEVDRIIDQYRRLVFPTDYMVAEDLIRDFHELLQQLPQMDGEGGGDMGDPFGHDERPVEVLTIGRARGITDQRKAALRIKDGEPEKDPNSKEKKGGKKSKSDSSDAGSGMDEAGVKAMAGRLLVAVLARDEVKEDLQRSLRTVNGSTASDTIKQAYYRLVPPWDAYREQQAALRRTFEKLMRDADPGWHWRTSYGRLNAHRWIMERDVETAFDTWDEGVQDAIDMELVILLDDSGSTADVYDETANAMWVIKRACDSIDVSSTVLLFSSSAEILYHRHEKASSEIRHSYRGGGTVPVDALKQAAHIFARTRKTQKILIVLTDGDWQQHPDDDFVTPNEYIERMRRAGVTTALGYFEPSTAYDYWGSVPEDERPDRKHGVEIYSELSVDAMVPFIKTIVVSEIQKRLAAL